MEETKESLLYFVVYLVTIIGSCWFYMENPSLLTLLPAMAISFLGAREIGKIVRSWQNKSEN